MKLYGANKATEFSKKQINVLYAMNKQGKLTIADDTLNTFYKLAEYYGYDDNGSVEWAERKVLIILDAAFAGDLEKAQRYINEF